MRPDQFSWPADLYDPDFGIRAASLQSVGECDRLWEHAARSAVWPPGDQGRLEFHALAIYCLRVGKPPGRLLTSAVRGQKFGPMLWASSRDKKSAARRISAAKQTANR